MHKKFSILTAVAMVVGVVAALTPTAAQAVTPTAGANYHSNDQIIGSANIDANAVSDRDDGVDTVAALRGVGTTNTSLFIVTHCPGGTFPGGTGVVPPSGCATIGQSTTPVAPFSPTGATGDEAYQVLWNVPPEFNNSNRDFGYYYCTGTPTNNEPGGNCLLDVDANVLVDDAQAGSEATSTAEFVALCIDRAPFSGAPNTCDFPNIPMIHGAEIPKLPAAGTNEQWILIARSSSDIATLGVCSSETGGATPPNHCDQTLTDAGNTLTPGTKEYRFRFAAGEFPFGDEQQFTLFDATGGSGQCAGTGPTECSLSSLYFTETQNAQGSQVMSWATFGATCAAPDTSESDPLGTANGGFVCTFARNGDPFNGAPVTLELPATPNITFTACEGTMWDTDGDGRNDRCEGSSGGDNIFTFTVNNAGTGAQTGTFTVNGCTDDEQPGGGGGALPIQPERFGCADETLKSSANKTYTGGAPARVSLVFVEGSNGCTGPTVESNVEGDEFQVRACVFDASGNPVDTTTGPGAQFDLQWFLTQAGDDETDVEFTTSPPQETDASAQAVASLLARDAGTDDINVNLRGPCGIGGAFVVCSTAFVEKEVTEPGGGTGQTINFTGQLSASRTVNNRRNATLRAVYTTNPNDPDGQCLPGHRVELFKNLPTGGERLVTRALFTGPDGSVEYSVRRTRRAKTYHFHAAGTQHASGPDTHVCTAADSGTVRVPKKPRRR